MSSITAHDTVLLALKSDYEGHAADTANPHAVTAAQAGAPTLAALAATDTNVSNNAAALAAHIADLSNPHDVELSDVADSGADFDHIESHALAQTATWQNAWTGAKEIDVGTLDPGERGYVFLDVQIENVQYFQTLLNGVELRFTPTGPNMRINNQTELVYRLPIVSHGGGSTIPDNISSTIILRVHNADTSAITENIGVEIKFDIPNNVSVGVTKAYMYRSFLTGQLVL